MTYLNIDIYLWCLHSKHLTSTSDVSQKSTTPWELYNFVLRLNDLLFSISSQPSADRHVTNSWPKAPA